LARDSGLPKKEQAEQIIFTANGCLIALISFSGHAADQPEEMEKIVMAVKANRALLGT
jgi:hypothetical protein